MLAISPEILLVKIPAPIPSVVFVDEEIVGLAFVLQQTPLAVMLAPPSLDIFPPEIAVVFVIDDIGVVVNVGKVIFEFPFPSELVEQE